MSNWHDICDISEIADSEVIGRVANGIPLALFRLEDDVFALKDLCPHGAARLSDGFVEDDCVECPLHQGLIDIRTGAPRSAPITTPVARYEVRVTGTRVEVAL